MVDASDELAAVQDAAQTAGVSLGTWIRDAILETLTRHVELRLPGLRLPGLRKAG